MVIHLLSMACIYFCSLMSHPVYVSVTNVDIDQEGKQIILSLKIFTEELETVLHSKYGIDGWIGTPEEHKDSRKFISEYIDERFSLVVNYKEKLSLTKDSMKIHEDAFWIYMNSSFTGNLKHLEINNRILTEFFYSQTNLVIVGVGKKEKGYKLDRKNHKIELSL